MRTIRRAASLVVLPFVVLLFGACGGDSSTGPDGDDPSFEISLSGDVSETFSGDAVFESGVSQEGVNGFGVVAANPGGGVQSFGLVRQGSRPGSGQFSIADPRGGTVDNGEFLFVVSYQDGAGNTVTLGSTGGSVTIDESSGSHVRGTFQAEVVGATISGSQVDSVSATADGSFNAVHANDYSGGGG